MVFPDTWVLAASVPFANRDTSLERCQELTKLTLLHYFPHRVPVLPSPFQANLELVGASLFQLPGPGHYLPLGNKMLQLELVPPRMQEAERNPAPSSRAGSALRGSQELLLPWPALRYGEMTPSPVAVAAVQVKKLVSIHKANWDQSE